MRGSPTRAARRVALLLGLFAIAPAAACSAFFDLDDASARFGIVDAASDSPVSEAGSTDGALADGSAGRFCERQPDAGLVFCDDFDLGDAGERWTDARLDFPGFALVRDALSPPFALELDVSATGVTTPKSQMLRRDLPLGAAEATFAFAIDVRAYPPATSSFVPTASVSTGSQPGRHRSSSLTPGLP
jgi:hypothetical protein